jgi:peptidoglycan/xylan/chitin deacetylase (PgdA/CDA1 family)
LNALVPRIVILMYHIVDHPKDEAEARFCCTPDRFDKQMRHLVSSGIPLMTMEHISECFSGMRAWPARGIVVTLDDGYQCAYTNALPVLERYKVPAIVFLVAGKVGETNNWAHLRKVPARKLLDWRELRELPGRGMSLGSHTVSHPRLPELPSNSLSQELSNSRMILEDRLGISITHFAYPYGQMNEAVRDAAEQSGYRTACSTRPGFNNPDIDRFALRRIEIYGHDSLLMFKQKLKFGMNNASVLFPLRYHCNRLFSKIGVTRKRR